MENGKKAKDEFRREIGKRLFAVRMHLDMNQEPMAEQLGISRANLYRLERGDILPNAYVLHILSKKYNISPEWLINGEDEMFRKKQPEVWNRSDFGKDAGLVEELVRLMRMFPFLRYEVLNFFMDLYDEHQEIIEKIESIQEEYKKKLEGKT